MQALLINGSKKFGNDGTRLNATLQSVAKEELESKGYKVLETIIDKGYKVEEELKKIKDSHLIIYQMPAWWMGEPWIVKKYIDEVYLAGVGVLFANDGRSRADESLKYGSGGLARDKRVMLSVTWNAPKEAFIESNGFFEGVGVEGVYLHLRKAHEFCGMEWLPIFMCNDVVKNPQVERYITKYREHIRTYC
ncbi:NAD(P)H-dependent oxidoreductase [Campylobacter upsaliensis]|uniref:NAD(P)H-dependent oxidoreductase n=1 Tax=Campylobacter upsaliensis TaxID=28080 RepID=UPI0012807DB0|nr:NAD(P)H-dependent oxidoreductase [Campylobacter upsaliensis]EAI7390005.1 NAD(P)H-dependent oxidoreductase [Campylobacter upsaliensis]EAJ5220988.1 NAD(P)H-dependent oxidoreductase [Campylobacter upsaliensis]EAK3282407.1 NAD(P)H-dependent oxidoreductase [Campylobacter upsaliensis]EAK5115861.1 NAD(P)H-dependent oxidoreductase [Campylobacter upsaliensis]EAK5389941.1 NAD(P)H-dependent oxidoreductase [Campylobacter upsaliensis]